METQEIGVARNGRPTVARGPSRFRSDGPLNVLPVGAVPEGPRTANGYEGSLTGGGALPAPGPAHQAAGVPPVRVRTRERGKGVTR